MMKLSLLLSFLVISVESKLRGKLRKSFSPPPVCGRFADLPEECHCHNGHGAHSLIIDCQKPFNTTFLNDTIGVKLVVEPCDPLGSSLAIDITDTAHSVDFPISSLRAGESQVLPIPGLSFMVPQLGHIGVDAVVDIAGNPDLLILNVGLDACLAVRHKFICAESLPMLGDVFPWWILSGNYSFGDYCSDMVGRNISRPLPAVQ